MVENEILLNDGQREYLFQLLKTQNFFPDQPSDLFRAEILKAWRPVFLDESCYIFQAELSDGDKLLTFCFLHVDCDSNTACFVLNSYLNYSVFEEAASFRGSPVITLNEKTAISYLRCCLTGDIYPSIMLESLDELTAYDPVRCSTLRNRDFRREVVFYTPLEEFEKSRIVQALSDNSVKIIEQSESFFIIEVCILKDDVLSSKTYKLHTIDEPLSFDRKNPKKAGQLEEIGIGRELVSGLPDNYVLSKFAFPGFSFTNNTENKEGWEAVQDYEQDLILRDVSRTLIPLIKKPQAFRRKYLPFYNIDIIIIEAEIGFKKERILLLWKPGTTIFLDGSSAPIHDYNEALMDEKGGNVFLENIRDAADYARFFCASIWGEDDDSIAVGPFTIVESSLDPLFSNVKPEDVDYDQERFTSVDDLYSSITPITVTGADGEENNFYQAQCYVAYGNVLFLSKLAVTKNGMIEMIDDEPLAVIATWGNTDKPYGKFESLKESTRLDPVYAEFLDGKVIEDKLIIGKVKIHNSAITRINRCRFRGEVDLSNFSSDGGLSIENSVFEGGLKAEGVRLNGTFEIYSTVMLTRNKQETEPSINFARLSCCDLSIHNLSVRGTLDFSGINARSLFLWNLKLLGDADLQHASIEQYITIDGLTSGGSLNLYGAVVHQNYVQILGPLSIAGDFTATSLRAGTSVYIGSESIEDGDELSVIGGDIYLAAAEVPNGIRIQNVRSTGEIFGRYLKTGLVRICGPGIQYSSSGKLSSADDSQQIPEVEMSDEGIQPAETPDITSEDIEQDTAAAEDQSDGSADKENKPVPGPMIIKGGIDFSYAKIENDAIFIDIEVQHKPDKPLTPDLSFRSAEIGRDLRVFATSEWMSRNDYYTIRGNDTLRSVFPGGIDISQGKSGGTVDLSCVLCHEGEINMDDAEIFHDLIISPVKGETARALRLEMDSLTCHGNAIITGLQLLKNDACSGNIKNCGVSARFSRFERSLITASINANKQEEIAVIHGILDLTGSEIRELSVSNKSFSFQNEDLKNSTAEDSLEEQRCGVILNQATVNKLTSVISDRKYPRPIDLRYAEIKWWSFFDTGGSHSGTTRDFIELLNGDPHLQRHTFRSIEKNLIDQGNEDTADDIHREMRKWIRRQLLKPGKNKFISAKNRLKSSMLWVWDTATGSATTPFRLLVLVLLWFCLSTRFFSFEENIVPTTQALVANHEILKPGQHPGSGEWKGMASFWVAIRYHIPVATFTAQDDWQPTGKDPLILFKYNKEENPVIIRARWITAEDYANIVTGLHWILWPVILVLASRKFFRNLDK